MKIGIIQGRLSEPKEGFQECPINWKREFDLLPELGLNHIEWIITSNNFRRSSDLIKKVTSKMYLNWGKTMYKAICQLFAPSTRADSMGSVGNDIIPEKIIRKTNGVHCHVSALIITTLAQNPFDNHAIPVSF